MLTIPAVAEVLDRARDSAPPGREAAEANAVLRSLWQLLQPPKPVPRWRVRDGSLKRCD